MRPFFPLFALAVLTCSTPAAAGWVLLVEHTDYVAYIEDAPVARSGTVARLRDMIDLRSPRTSPYGVAHLSSLAESEFDCNLPRMRTLAFALYAGAMADGGVVEEVTPSPDWMPVFDGTLLQTLRRYACN